MKRNVFWAWMMLPVALLLPSCQDDTENVFPVEDAVVVLSDTRVEIGSEGRYYSINASASDSLFAVRVATDAGWIHLNADSLSSEGNIRFYVEPNGDTRGREADIVFRLGNHTQQVVATVYQRSEAEESGNALPGDSLTRRSRVGYGYDMLVDFMDLKSVTLPILDYGKLKEQEAAWGTIIAEEGRSVQDLDIYCSSSIEDMASWMTQRSTSHLNVIFYNQTIEKFRKISEHSLDQRTFGFGSLQKTVATRYVDEGKLESIIRQGKDIFSADFREIYDKVNTSATQEDVETLVRQFGTHLVVHADLGGRLDYMVNFKSMEVSRVSAEKYLKYKYGKLVYSSETEEVTEYISDSDGFLDYVIYGGADEMVASLDGAQTVKDRYAQLDPALLGGWLGSIKSTVPGSLALVDCRLLPIWSLFTSPEARRQIINHILKLAYSEGGEVGERLRLLSLDNYYRFAVTDGMKEFATGKDATLVRLLYFDGVPKVEICNEYVPELRGDRRITVFYPIYKEQTNIRRGIFLGDDENPPSEVMFDRMGGCYVRPLEGYQRGSKINTLYYIDGAFYTHDFGLEIKDVRMEAEDHYMYFKGFGDTADEVAYPVVKIGPGYWTRQNMKERMEFGEPIPDDPYGGYYLHEELLDGMLYAGIFYGNSNAFRENNPGLFDDSTDADGNRIRWFVPRVSDIRTLENYIGHNCKVLFPSQQSGFEVQFAGYYGDSDDLNKGNYMGGYDLRYVGKYCFIAAKGGMVGTGEALVLSPDYTLKRCEINKVKDNLYPIRPYRSSFYKYETKR